MLFKPLLRKFFVTWAIAIAIFTSGVFATPTEQGRRLFVPLPQFVFSEIATGQEYYLFDQNVNTEYPALLSSSIFTALGSEGQTIDYIRVYGNASYSLTVRANQQGKWDPVTDLQNLDLSVLQPDEWHEFKVATCVTTTDLIFDLAPVFQLQNEDVGLSEIQIWVKAVPGCSEIEKKLPNSSGNENSPSKNQALNNSTKGILSSSSAKTEKVVPGQAKKISHEEAELDINAEAVTVEKDLTIDTLSDSTLPALDPGMTNVTKGPRKGYRFLPSGKFNKKINVKIPYDKSLLPTDKTESDILTFYFDKELGRWQALKLVTLDTKGHNVISETDHFTDMINAT